ncbi:rhodanese-like domain-containing protein [Algoriphagus mannitolivorans]|uniref:rhodanese-like domain-containing protein n=1 Tax=Algoriphagus mannitolivorans TaxID=226504 RepID=UPI0003FD10B2|nr:rhodanese-like domain-containing protein [Algoriphagus mannitolivorans]
MRNFLSLIALFILLISSCSSPKEESQSTETANSSASVESLDPKEFSEKSQSGIILDVRTPQEITQGKIPGSLALNFYEPDFLSKATELPKDSEIFIYCAVGARSQEAGNLLIQQGYTKVYHLRGGIQAWSMSGLPIE